MNHWYVLEQGAAQGPFTPAEMTERLQSGQLPPATLV